MSRGVAQIGQYASLREYSNEVLLCALYDYTGDEIIRPMLWHQNPGNFTITVGSGEDESLWYDVPLMRMVEVEILDTQRKKRRYAIKIQLHLEGGRDTICEYANCDRGLDPAFWRVEYQMGGWVDATFVHTSFCVNQLPTPYGLGCRVIGVLEQAENQVLDYTTTLQ